MSSTRSASKCEAAHTAAMDADARFADRGKPTPGERPMNRITSYSFSALGWIAVSFGLIVAADARPFDPMIGCWSGQGQLYDQNGAADGQPVNSTGSVTWKTPYTQLHFKQVQQTPS